MSKMSQLHMELSEKACELGFQSIEDAQVHGYDVDYENRTLVDGRELAHRDWLERKEEILAKLKQLSEAYKGAEDITSVVEEAIEFIKRGEI